MLSKVPHFPPLWRFQNESEAEETQKVDEITGELVKAS
jgi:hypothetical protein